jgi:hypothetical protein
VRQGLLVRREHHQQVLKGHKVQQEDKVLKDL